MVCTKMICSQICDILEPWENVAPERTGKVLGKMMFIFFMEGIYGTDFKTL